MKSKLEQRIAETKEYMNLNYDPTDDDDGYTDDDAIDHLREECGELPDGGCALAGTEYCDFECPFGG